MTNGKKFNEMSTWERVSVMARNPFVMKSYAWGACCSGLVMAHKMRLYRGNIGHALRAGLATFLLVTVFKLRHTAYEIQNNAKMKYEFDKQLREKNLI
mmetsp:Transcript_15866/g.23894  ORF Transcript_15866/g.23894 Transcript_15866/m.23894 type:complete len:98 (-) Transcript_15866:25-318(-)